VRKIIEKAGYLIISWTIDPQDWKPGRTPQEVSQKILEEAKSKSIILLHVHSNPAPQALSEIIPKLKERNFEFVTISDLLKN